jgi:hypothetical protein
MPLTVTLLSAMLTLAGCGHNRQDVNSSSLRSASRLALVSGADCHDFIVLTSNGTLRYDKDGELPVGTVHTTNVTQAELDAAIPVLTDSSLVKLLDLPGQICQPPFDISETMTLTMNGTRHSHATTGCDNQPLTNAEGAQ